MKTIKLLLPLIAILISTISLPLTANAVSAYDDAIQITEDIILTNYDTGTTTDVTNTYIEAMQTCNSTAYDHFIANALTPEGMYAVTTQEQHDASANGMKNRLHIYWAEDNLAIDNSWFAPGGDYGSTQGLSVGGFSHFFELRQEGDGSLTCFYGTSGYYPMVSNNLSSPMTTPGAINKARLFVTQNMSITYPEGYEGNLTPVIIDQTVIRPELQIEVVDKKVSVKSPPSQLMIDNYGEPYVIYYVIDNLSEYEEEDYEPFGYSGWGLPDQAFTFDVPKYQTITITAQFQTLYHEEIPDTDYTDYTTTTVPFEVDGSYYSFSTNDYVCEDGFCTPPPPEVWEPETCDLLNLGGCVRNIMYYIGDALGIVPSRDNPTGSPFYTFQTQDTGGLFGIIAAPLNIFYSIQSNDYVCSPITVPLPNLTGTFDLPCLTEFYETNMGDFYTIYQVIVNGIVAYFVVVGMLRMVKDFKDPQKDRIEVADL